MGIRKTAILLAAVMRQLCSGMGRRGYDTRIEQAFVNMPEIEAVVYAADGAGERCICCAGRNEAGDRADRACVSAAYGLLFHAGHIRLHKQKSL